MPAKTELDQLWEIMHRLAWAPYSPENMVVAPSDDNVTAAYKDKLAMYYTRTVTMAADLTSDTGKHYDRISFMTQDSPSLEWQARFPKPQAEDEGP